MKILDTYIEKHLKNRKNGFYFWICKKNFLSIYIFTKYLNDYPDDDKNIQNKIEYIFETLIKKIQKENDNVRKKTLLDNWKNYSFYYYKSDCYINKPIYSLNNIQPYNLYLFLYKNKYSIEEFFAYNFDNIINYKKLFEIAISCFTKTSDIIDDYNSHASKIYLIKCYYPFFTLKAHKKIQNALWIS
jgi:hypothetical protein